MRELMGLQDEPIEGVRVVINEENMMDVQAELDGPPGTPYEGGLFRMRLALDSQYPDVAPKGYFLTKIFHPNVSAAGDICVNVLKRDWKPDMGLRHILLVIRCLLIEPNADSALNEEAGKLLLEDFDEFARRARLMTGIHAQVSGAGRVAVRGAGGASAPADGGAPGGSGARPPPLMAGGGVVYTPLLRARDRSCPSCLAAEGAGDVRGPGGQRTADRVRGQCEHGKWGGGEARGEQGDGGDDGAEEGGQASLTRGGTRA